MGLHFRWKKGPICLCLKVEKIGPNTDKKLKEKYKSEIEILLAYEVDYLDAVSYTHLTLPTKRIV